MKLLALLTLILLTSCSSLPSAEIIGQTARNAESALCPLQTAKNLDNTLVNILAIIPLISWDPVCPPDE